MTIEEQLADIEVLKRKIYMAALHKATIILDALGDRMDHEAKLECDVLVEAIRWAEKQLLYPVK